MKKLALFKRRVGILNKTIKENYPLERALLQDLSNWNIFYKLLLEFRQVKKEGFVKTKFVKAMKEDFLHYVWKYKLFSTPDLCSVSGELIRIVSSGTHNLNSGPDFFNAQLKVADQLWAGNVEVHVNSSDWYAHNHQSDENYDNVILHVVWNHDVDVFGKGNWKLPTLELKRFVSEEVLSNYRDFMSKPLKWIYCENEIHSIDEFKFNHWLEQLYLERLEEKSQLISALLERSNNNWEAVLFQMISKNFGLKVNAEAFLSLANSIDFSLIRKSCFRLNELEALLFGQAGFLETLKEGTYYKELQKEYNYLKIKYRLEAPVKCQFQFFRLRPANFPTIRISQLANLYHKQQSLFSELMKINTMKACYKFFDASASIFWETHYTFEKESPKRIKKISKSLVDLMMINTVIPMRFVYLKQRGAFEEEQLFELIAQIKPEKNRIVDKFQDLRIMSKSAFETQALLQLKNEYCSKQKCLKCVVGHELLRR